MLSLLSLTASSQVFLPDSSSSRSFVISSSRFFFCSGVAVIGTAKRICRILIVDPSK